MSLLWVSVLVQADPDAAAKYQSCAVCHGERGQGNIELGAPALAGQGAQYLERQLQYFKSGVRGTDPRDMQGLQMQAMAGALADEDIPVVAAYLSGLPPAVPTAVPKGDLKNGNNYYQSKCGACHGGQAQGNSGLNSPAWLY
jgi:cytochrome c553